MRVSGLFEAEIVNDKLGFIGVYQKMSEPLSRLSCQLPHPQGDAVFSLVLIKKFRINLNILLAKVRDVLY